jgi:hypothetical protein
MGWKSALVPLFYNPVLVNLNVSLEFQMFRSCYKLTAMRIAQILTET